MIDATIFKNAALLWGYMCLNEQPRSADLLLVLGSVDDRVAAYAAELSRQFIYPLTIFSGGVAHQDDLLATSWEVSEAEYFYDVFLQHGGVQRKMLLETQAQNTGDNAKLSYELVIGSGQKIPRTMQVVTKPYMERRAKATFDVQWPNKSTRIFMASPPLSFDQYCNDTQPYEKVINLMVGDLQRIIEYPKKSLQSEQIIPTSVREALDVLITAGFTKHLIK